MESTCRYFSSNHIDQITKKHIFLPKSIDHIAKKPISLPKTRNPFSRAKKNYGDRKKADTEISHTTLVDIHVEDCPQYANGEKSPSFSNTSSDNNKDTSDCESIHSQLKPEKKSMNQFKYRSSIESVLDSVKCTKSAKKNSTKETTVKGKRLEEDDADAETSNGKSSESSKKIPSGSKCSKLTIIEKMRKDKGKNDSAEAKLKAKKSFPVYLLKPVISDNRAG